MLEIEGIAPDGYQYGTGALNRVTAPREYPVESYMTTSPVQGQSPPYQLPAGGDGRNDDLYDNPAPSGYSSFPVTAPVPPSPAYQPQRGHTQTHAIQQNYPGPSTPAYGVSQTPRQPQNNPNPAPPYSQSYTNTLPRSQSQVPLQSINRTGMNMRDILNQGTAIPVQSLLKRDTPAPHSRNPQSANQIAPGPGRGQPPSQSRTGTALERNAPGSRALRSPGVRDPAQNEGNPFAQPVFVPEKTFERSALTFSQLTAQVADMAISNGPVKEGASSKAGESSLDVRSKGTSSKVDSKAANAAKEKEKGSKKHGKK